MKILYVEDDADLREIVAFGLGLEPTIDLRTIDSGEAALRVLDSEPDWRPDGLLLDVMMPGMDGVATLGAIRRRPEHARTPAAFISAKRDPRLAQVDPYVTGLVEKPFDPMTLAQRLRRLFSGTSRDGQGDGADGLSTQAASGPPTRFP